MDQVRKAFHDKDDYYRDHAHYDEFYAEYTKHMSKFDWQIVEINQILTKQKKSTGLYEYPSTPSIILHLGEGLDSKPRGYFERTK